MRLRRGAGKLAKMRPRRLGVLAALLLGSVAQPSVAKEVRPPSVDSAVQLTDDPGVSRAHTVPAMAVGSRTAGNEIHIAMWLRVASAWNNWGINIRVVP